MKKLLLVIPTFFILAQSLFAQWVGGGTQVSFSVSNAHRPFVSAAANGGYYSVWQATDTTVASLSSIHLNAFDANGAVLTGWVSGGTTISAPGDFFAPQLITAEDGGAIVFWYGYPDTSSRSHIYAQKYSSAGTALWNSGQPVQVSTGTSYVDEYPLIVSDKSNGAFVVWTRFDSLIDASPADVMLQHIDNNGNVAGGWNANGAVVASAPNVRNYYPQLALTPDLSAVYVAYASGLIGNTSLILNKFKASHGTLSPGWSASGVLISSGPNVYPEINHDLKLYADNTNNAVVFWLESRNTANGEIYMQQVSPTATQLLTANGQLLYGDFGPNDGTGAGVDYLEVQQDADHNFLVAYNNLINFNDVAAMRVQANGNILWSDTLVTTGGYSAYPFPVSDGNRGMFVFYTNTNNPEKLYAIALDSNGVKYNGWSLPGSGFGDLSNYDGFNPNYDYNAVATASGKAVVAWNRVASGFYQVFDCNLLSNGQTCTEQAQAPFSVNIGPDQTACNGATLTLSPVITGGVAPFTFTWQAIGNSLSCTHCRNPMVTITQNSTYIVTVTDSGNNTASDTVNITVNVPGTISSSGPDTFCSGHPVVLETAAVSSGYQWLLNGNPIPGAINNSYTVADSSGSYRLVYGQEGACPDTTNAIHVLVYATPSATITPSGPQTICQHDSITFQAASGPGLNYLWTLGGRDIYDSTNMLITKLAGNYQLVVTSPNGCTDSGNVVNVTVRPLPIVGFQPFSNFTLCSNGAPVTLTGGIPAGGVFSGASVTADSIFNPSAASPGLNIVAYTFTDDYGCSNTAFENITVENCTGINNLSEKVFLSMYPNPANDYVMISVGERAVGAALRVSDMTGRNFLNIKVPGEDFRIETAGLADEMYLVSMTVNGEMITKKLTVTR